MRIILFTGKGGVGKTSLAAATALAAAKRGKPTLILSTDPAHSLGDALKLSLSGEPSEIQPHLWAMEVDAAQRFEEFYADIQKYLVRLFTHFHMDEVVAEELAVFPGMDELLSLAEVYAQSQKKKFKVIIIDTAPTGNTLRLLSFPEIAEWYGRKILPLERKFAKVAKPIVNRVSRMPLVPDDELYQNFQSLLKKVDQLHKLFTDRTTASIRLVLQPEKMVIRETQRAYTSMLLFGFPVDACLVNRVIPKEAGAYFSRWHSIQQKYMEDIKAAFSPLPILTAPYYPEEMIGVEALERLSRDLYEERDPTQIFYKEKPLTIKRRGKKAADIKIKMPFLDKDLDLFQSGNEIIIRCGSMKHHLMLPDSMITFEVTDYAREAEELHIHLNKRESWE